MSTATEWALPSLSGSKPKLAAMVGEVGSVVSRNVTPASQLDTQSPLPTAVQVALWVWSSRSSYTSVSIASTSGAGPSRRKSQSAISVGAAGFVRSTIRKSPRAPAVCRIDWSTVTPQSFGYKLRQGPGDGNALGRFKFMFPNRFSVYLHDTPARSLFQRAQRSFSSGCIRVQDPELLAEILLSDMPDWTLDRINATVVEGRNTVVSLPEPVPVHLSYLTAWVNKDGSVHFRSDIYDRDVELADALMGTRVGLTF